MVQLLSQRPSVSHLLPQLSLSSARNIHTGVPQGAVTSPKLFNFYLYHLPQPPLGVDLVMYADDLSAYATGVDVQILCDRLNTYVPILLQFFEERDLIVSPEKSSHPFLPPTKPSSRTPSSHHKWHSCSTGETTKDPRCHS